MGDVVKFPAPTDGERAGLTPCWFKVEELEDGRWIAKFGNGTVEGAIKGPYDDWEDAMAIVFEALTRFEKAGLLIAATTKQDQKS